MTKYIASLALILAVLFSVAPAAQAAPEQYDASIFRSCKYEDSMNCFWDASSQGNGKGHSFIAVQIGKINCIIYTDRKYARRHNYCF